MVRTIRVMAIAIALSSTAACGTPAPRMLSGAALESAVKARMAGGNLSDVKVSCAQPLAEEVGATTTCNVDVVFAGTTMGVKAVVKVTAMNGGQPELSVTHGGAPTGSTSPGQSPGSTATSNSPAAPNLTWKSLTICPESPSSLQSTGVQLTQIQTPAVGDVQCQYKEPPGSSKPAPEATVDIWHQSTLTAVDGDDVFWQGSSSQPNTYTSNGNTFTVIPTTVDGAPAHAQAGDDGCDLAVQGTDGSVIMVQFQLVNTPQSFGGSTAANLNDAECQGARSLIADFAQAAN